MRHLTILQLNDLHGYLGDIMADLDGPSGHIVWQCPVCSDHGLIHGWEETLWNRHGGARAESSDTPPTRSH